MPTPNKNETERDYVKRCVPILIGEGKKPDEAVAVCHSMWDEHKKSNAVASMSAAYVLNLDDKGAAAVPLGLEGFPTKDSEGNDIHYRKMKIAHVGQWTHRGTGEQFEISRQRADEWVNNTKSLAAAGVKPFVPGEHRETFNAKDNHGYIERIERDGDDVYAIAGLTDEGLKLAARNGRSIYVVKDAKDAKGNVYAGESLHHLALVPNPALPDLGGTVRIAASADRPAVTVPVYVLAAATPSSEVSTMTKELAQQFRTKLGVAADVPDDKLPQIVFDKVVALSADVEKVTKERDTLKTDRDAKAQEVLALSAGNKEYDPMTLGIIADSFDTKRKAVIAAGVISEAGMKAIDSLYFSDGKPTKAALALSAGSAKPHYARLLEIIESNPGVKHNNDIPRDVKARTEAEESMRLSLSGDSTDPKKLDRQAELLREQLGLNKKTA
jgi:hypothetical protein